MGLKLVCVVLLTTGFCVSYGYSQNNVILCPTLKINSPEIASVEQKVSLVAEATGNFTNVATYIWTVSSGKIVDGQGTPVAGFEAQEDDQATIIKINVKLTGLPIGCSSVEASGTVEVAPLPIGEPCDTLDEFPKQKIEQRLFLSRLDSYIQCIDQTKGYEGLIAAELPNSYTRLQKIAYLKRIFDHFVFRKFELTRITFAVGVKDGPVRANLWTIGPKARLPRYIRGFELIKGEEFRRRITILFRKTD
jgi:hypothetical protein